MYEIYKATATALRLTMDPPDPGLMAFFIDLDGVVDNQRVHIRRVVTADGFFVVSSSWLTPLGAGLSVSRVGLVDTILGLVGFHDLEVGDSIFDDAFRVKAKDRDRALAILREEVRGALLRLGGESTLTDQSIQTRFDRGAESTELLTQTCHDVALVATLVQALAPQPPYRSGR
jgi:hypothetical protein